VDRALGCGLRGRAFESHRGRLKGAANPLLFLLPMNTSKNIDLIIIGSGPAGLSTALHLVQNDQGWNQRMIILEKDSHPRPKLCGGGLTRFGQKILRDLAIQLPLPIPQARVENIHIIFQKRAILVHGKPQFIVYHRPDFDHFLAQKAQHRGVQIQQNEEVESLEVMPDHVKVTTNRGDYQAKIVVGAEGSSGIVRKLLKDRTSHSKIARTLEVRTSGDHNSSRFTKQAAIFDFTGLKKNLKGYFWDFPSYVNGKPSLNLGVYDSSMVKRDRRAGLSEILNKGLISSGVDPAGANVQSAPIHLFHPNNPMSKPRICLVGDAAGVDVLFGEGIGPSLGYGKTASVEINKAFQSGNFNFQNYRQNVLLSPVGRYLLIRWVVAGYLYHLGHLPGFTHALWTVAQILARIWRPGLLD
jgi:flavin-dependent dehydrogenase